MQLQEAVENEINQMLADGVEKINNEVFIQPVVITVKRDKPAVNIALDARSLNNAIQTEKYQMPSMENLMEQVPEVINS